MSGSAAAATGSGPGPNRHSKPVQTSSRDHAGSKRSRLDDTISPRGAKKKPCLNESRAVHSASYADAVKGDLIVAITSDTPTGHLNQEQADHILASLQPLLHQEALNYREGDARILFKGKPIFKGGVLKLWCDDARTVDWLKAATKKVTLPSGDKICVRRLADVPRRVRCGILLPGVWKDMKVVGLQLQYHNDWAQVHRWLLLRAEVQEAETFVVVSIPEDLVSTVMEHNRCLGFFFGSVYIKFQGPKGKFTERPPVWNKPTVENVTTSAKSDSDLNKAAIPPSLTTESEEQATAPSTSRDTTDAPMEVTPDDELILLSVDSGDLESADSESSDEYTRRFGGLALGQEEGGMLSDDGEPLI
ncbi:unnamed protein product [Colias eurytheme]|nr:unnamed protein product [Colias eurytheme]